MTRLHTLRPELAATASQQHGVFTRRQAMTAGYRGPAIRDLTRPHGPWVVVRRGVYAERTLHDSLDETGRLVLGDWAAHVATGVGHVMSHDSAARAHGIPMLRSPHPLAHVTRPGVGGTRTEHGVKHHLGRRPPDPVVVADLPVTGLVRTALDLAREHGAVAGTIACDRALWLGHTRVELDLGLEVMRHWPYVSEAQAAVDQADDGAETIAETLARLLVEEAGFQRPRSQVPLPLPGGTIWVDLLVGCHVVEFDGRIKALRPDQGGVSRDPVEALWRMKERGRLVAGLGLGYSGLIWEDVWGPLRTPAMSRLRSEIAVTRDRFGMTLPAHLEEFVRVVGRRTGASLRRTS